MSSDKKYFSSHTGEEISTVIQSLNNMHPMIKIINANDISTIECYSNTIGVDYDETKTVVDNECVFDLPEYADYIISYTKSGVDTTVLQPVYEFKSFEVSLDDGD